MLLSGLFSKHTVYPFELVVGVVRFNFSNDMGEYTVALSLSDVERLAIARVD